MVSMGRPTLFDRPLAWIVLVFLVPTLGAIATMGAAIYAGHAWIDTDWSVAVRCHYSAVVIATAVLDWLLQY